MLNLFKAFLFKLTKDLTFRITLLVGLGIAIFTAAIFYFLNFITEGEVNLLTGENMLIISLSPTQNFGLAIPINLITFTVIEFNHGSIRNKIIAGNSKSKIYGSLFISGLVFSLSLIIIYALVCFGLGTMFGGFNLSNGRGGILGTATIDATYLFRMVIVGLISYVSITAFSILFSTLFRQIGATIPIVIISIIGCYLVSIIPSLFGTFSEESEGVKEFLNVIRMVNPLYALGSQEMVLDTTSSTMKMAMSDLTFYSSIINNLVYTAIFFIIGLFIFKRRDVK